MSQTESVLVLVVDDDEFVRRMLERTLVRQGHEVVLAADGEAALQIALVREPAVIFLDLQMPGLSGHVVLHRLAAAAVSASVIVMSAHGEVGDVVDALRMGVVDYLPKPWKPHELAAALRRSIEVAQVLADAGSASPE